MKLSLLVAAVAALCVQADTTDHKYKNDEHVELWVNKVRFLNHGHFAMITVPCPRRFVLLLNLAFFFGLISPSQTSQTLGIRNLIT